MAKDIGNFLLLVIDDKGSITSLSWSQMARVRNFLELATNGKHKWQRVGEFPRVDQMIRNFLKLLIEETGSGNVLELIK